MIFLKQAYLNRLIPFFHRKYGSALSEDRGAIKSIIHSLHVQGKFWSGLIILFFITATVNAQIIYVDKYADGNNDGTSWDDAFISLQDALSVASEGSQIWVSTAIYYPDEGSATTENDMSATFQLKNGVEIYGGFLGKESSLSSRDWKENHTILSGDINRSRDHDGNSYSVVTGSGTNHTAVIDGFTIDLGNATGSGCTDREPCRAGGGIYNNEGSPTIHNIFFHNNKADFGGGIANVNQSSPVISGSQFISNQATNSGGGLSSVDFSYPQIIHTVIEQNTAGLFGGGLLDMENGNSTIIYSLIRYNSVNSEESLPSFGGGVAFASAGSSIMINTVVINNFARTGAGIGVTSSGSNVVLNATIANNSAAAEGGGIYVTDTADLTVQNSIIWNNSANAQTTTPGASLFNNSSGTTTISHSMIANSGASSSWNSDLGVDGGNNFDEDPLFLNIDNYSGWDGLFGTADDGFSLRSKNPLLNAGDNSPFESGGLANKISSDITGRERIHNGDASTDIVDLGAYEFQGEPFAAPDENNILYVNQNVSGGLANGTSWENAIMELREALSWAQAWDASANGTLQIWVAEGTYFPTDDPTNRMASFHLRNGIEIYGGFSGGESSRSHRDPGANETILNGDIDGNGDLGGGNSYSVVIGSGINSTAVLDGFTITLGNASENIRYSNDPKSSGGGIFISSGSAQILNCVVKVNRARLHGAGIYIYSGSPALSDLKITQNISSEHGGGIAISNRSAPLINRVIIQGNRAATNGGAGGGVLNEQRSQPKIINSEIRDNVSSNGAGIANSVFSNAIIINVLLSGNNAQGGSGGAIHNNTSDPILINSTLVNNSASFGAGGIYNRMIFDDPSDPVLKNVIIWNNTGESISTPDGDPSRANISYSLIQGSGGSLNWNGSAGTDGGNNLDTDPLFKDAANGDYSLLQGSPALNAGTNAPFESGEIADGITTDLAGNDRFYNNAIVDMGAYEFQGEAINQGPPALEIDGNPGWRMMGLPVAGVSVENLSVFNLIQGFSGLPQEIGDANLYKWNPNSGTDGAFVVPADKSTTLEPGTGFIWYMWGPEANVNLPESKSFPLTMELMGQEISGDVSLGTLSADWHLIANPFFSDIQFDQITDGTNQLGLVGSVWDPNEGSEGSYLLTTSSSMNNKLAAWQGAFVELSSETEVVIPQAAKTTGASFFKQQKRPLTGQVEFLLEGTANGVAHFDKSAILYFSEQATPDWDGYDVAKLTPFSEHWATLNFTGNRDGEQVFKSQHSLPYDFTDSQEIPVTIELQNTSGDFTLSWPVVKNLPDVVLWLLDRQTGKRHDLTQPGLIEFNMQASNKEQTASEVDSALRLPQIEPMRFKQNGEARFMILINPEELPEELPSQITLNQNYPNPFNPTTVIRYQLPVSSEVRLEVYDMLGRNVVTLVDGQVASGRHTVNFDASNLSSGIYLYRLQAGSRVLTRKLTVVK